jgi:hypothetical protein
MTATTHPFEKAGLGYAPFRCVGCRENWFEMPGFGRKPGGTCDYCGTGILYEFVIKSADGKSFVVGCDCVRKTGGNVADFDHIRLQNARERRAQKASARRATRQAQWEAERQARQAERQESATAWRNEHIALVNTLTEYAGTNAFLLSMQQQLREWGSLTARQVESTERVFTVQRRQAEAAANSKHVGTVGERVKSAKIRVVRSLQVGWNTFGYKDTPRILVTLEDDAGNQLTWWTSRHEEVSTEFATAAFTVKDHTVYNGTKQTIVQRVAFK